MKQCEIEKEWIAKYFSASIWYCGVRSRVSYRGCVM